jgi:hypothetical protein
MADPFLNFAGFLFRFRTPLRHLFPFRNRWYLQFLKERAVVNHRRS